MNELDDSNTVKTIWYKSRWGILVFGFPIASVIMGCITLYIAFTYPDSIVQDNYYKDGLSINQQIDDLEWASELKLRVQLNLSDGLINATINPALAEETQQVKIAFHHNLNEDLDTHIVLNRQSETEFVATMNPLKVANWYVDISPISGEKIWRVKGKINSGQPQWQLNAE
jgi:hypothetical protein